LAAAHISTVNCDEMAADRPKQPCVKNGYPLKKWSFYHYWLV